MSQTNELYLISINNEPDSIHESLSSACDHANIPRRTATRELNDRQAFTHKNGNKIQRLKLFKRKKRGKSK